ncbi:discoidin domain-containing protein [Paenibacillus donghaensis]|uniref:F5/8 type C domain-containing protein n=1 Tax=Paenibacillus donghaensis TaxID=414771 RepID=A0A2Z2KFL2_9BACL|nr:discoidin domain-containing protein [Paenibacillus donghaensis]ASA22785.1 hypothetical protein B9T62_19450 [Paenibacillus donghaensis]
MATLGQALTTPESGWKRIEDTHPYISYLGKTGISTSSVYTDSHITYTNPDAIGTSKISFKFYGTKIRLITQIGGFATTVKVKIDGIIESHSQDASPVVYRGLAYEKTGLILGLHTVEIYNDTDNMGFSLDAIDVDDIGGLSAPIGAVVTSPDAGWKRYDASFALLKPNGVWGSNSNSLAYNATLIFTDKKNSLKFSFNGTKIRLLGVANNGYSDSVNVIVDGVSETFSTSYGASGYQTLLYEKAGLQNDFHSVEIINNKEIVIYLDAIDIDSAGRLYHPDEVTEIKDLAVGKRIRCHYQASSGSVGTFSGLGKETSDFIPAASSATPNGDFYWIMVEDWNKNKILVADRNVQHSISWDALNTVGVASGSGLPIKIEGVQNSIFATLRLLTGGVSVSDKDNEWEKYIANFTLNGVAGDNNVWNWQGIFSWTSTTISGTNTNRVRRGTTTVATHASGQSGAGGVGQGVGFRPVLIIESKAQYKSIIKYDNKYKKWVEGGTPATYVDLTTALSGNNMAPYSAFASSEVAGYEAYRAFNKVKDAGWQTANASGNNKGWIMLDMGVEKLVTMYAITASNNDSAIRSPKDFKLLASTDNATWVQLDSQTGITWIDLQRREFIVFNTIPYRYYKLDIIINNGNSNFTNVGEIEFYNISSPATPSSWNTISTTLPSKDTFISEGMDDLSVLDRKPTNFVETMSDNGVLGAGEVFKKSVDLKKLFEITNIKIE